MSDNDICCVSGLKRKFCFLVIISFILIYCGVSSADWPTHRGGIARSGVTTEAIGTDLVAQWEFLPLHAPSPAWPMPGEEMPRVHADNGYHVAAVGGNVYFGSSITNKVYSIDAASGDIRWTFAAEGPVRFAPTVADGCVVFGSDDGFVYCLSTQDGRQLWKYRAGPSGEKVIGNGRMISLWPVRTSVLVDKGVVYFAAGVFPYEGLFICALNLKDASVVWKNDTIGDQVHDLATVGFSPQGYLIASDSKLYVPSGRAMPAIFDRATGKFLASMSPGGKRGGTWALLDGGNLIAGVDYSGRPHKVAYDADTGKNKGDVFAWFPGVDMVPTPDISYVMTLTGVYAIDRAVYVEASSKAAAASKERKGLAGRLSTARKGLGNADEAKKAEINAEIDKMTARINELAGIEAAAKVSPVKWQYERKGLVCLIKAGDIIFAGADGLVIGIDLNTGKEVWKADVAGKAVSLAVSGGRLFASSDKGPVYCFGAERSGRVKQIKAKVNDSPYREDALSKLYAQAADKIVKETSADKGYCLVLDCGEGRLAYELAKRTQMKIVGIETDAAKLATARKKLEEAGLLGKRVVVEPWDISDMPQYFANLVVSDGAVISGKTRVPRAQIERVVRPFGGISMLASKGMFGGAISWKKSVRGPLEGAGSWRQLYGNEGNTACSGDKLLTGSLGVLWFGDPGSERMPERHARGMSPVAMDGRLFVQGEEVVMALDPYNGTLLWERDIPGAVRVRVDVDGGNLALTKDALYVAAFDKCFRLDPATGAIVRTYEIPAAGKDADYRWGYISCIGNTLVGVAAEPLKAEYASRYKAEYGDGGKEDENDVVKKAFKRGKANWGGMGDFPSWGSQRNPKNTLTGRLMRGDTVFAVNADTGDVLWTYEGKAIANNSVSAGDGMLFFVDTDVSDEERAAAIRERQQLVERKVYFPAKRKAAQLDDKDCDVRLVVAVDIKSGDVVWKKAADLTGCGGDKMSTAYQNAALVFLGSFSNHDTGFFKKGELTWRRITVLNGKTGDCLWSRPLNYLRRPLVMGDKIIIEPRACDLLTGEIIMREDPITGKQTEWEFLRPGHCCAVSSASETMIFYRSYTPAMYDVAADKGVDHFAGIRPGCWINMIPANGLMMMPEASSGCTCSFAIRCSLVMANKPERVTSNWTVFINHGDQKPVKHLAINFGAPGDKRDDEGTMWFAYPRPRAYSGIGYGYYGVKFKLNEEVLEGMGPYCRDYRGVEVKRSDKPWLFTSGYRGLVSCKLPLIDEAAGQNEGRYTVRMGFNAIDGDKRGNRVFDIKLADKIVLRNFDVLKAARRSDRAVIREFKGIDIKNDLTVQFVPKTPDCDMSQAPIISFIEVIREDTEKAFSKLQ